MIIEDEYRKRVKIWNLPGHVHFYTFSCFRRQKFLLSDRTCGYLVDAINRAKETYGFHLWGYVFMPEHVHLLVWFPGEEHSFSVVAKAIKQSVATRALRYLRNENPAGLVKLATGQEKTRYRFWQQGPGYDRNLNAGVRERLVYMHDNPVRRGLVAYPEEWRWSSCLAWERGLTEPLRIDTESFPSN